MPTLVLPEFPSISGYRCVCSPLAGPETVCISECQVEFWHCCAVFWQSQTWFSEIIFLLDPLQWEIPIRKVLLSQVQGKI